LWDSEIVDERTSFDSGVIILAELGSKTSLSLNANFNAASSSTQKKSYASSIGAVFI